MTDHCATVRALLRHNHEKLLNQYQAAHEDLVAILQTLNEDIVPHLSFEMGLQKTDAVWLREWLDDTASIFRLLRRHQFTRSFTLQAIRTVLVWRLRVLRPILSRSPFPKSLHCLPPPISDPFGRPIVFIKVSALLQGSEIWNVQDALLQQVERLRLHLKAIRDRRTEHDGFPLQCIALVDLDSVSIQNVKNLDLLSWLLTDLIPYFPGMFAAVFLLNHSWMHSGVWSVAKRLLPESAISRVFFPSRNTLLEYCSPSTLPADYGGSLPPLNQIADPFRDSEPPPPQLEPEPLPFLPSYPPDRPRQPPPSSSSSSPPSPISGTAPTANIVPSSSRSRSRSAPGTPDTRMPTTERSRIIHLSPTSRLNPYFGYPLVVIVPSSSFFFFAASEGGEGEGGLGSGSSVDVGGGGGSGSGSSSSADVGAGGGFGFGFGWASSSYPPTDTATDTDTNPDARVYAHAHGPHPITHHLFPMRRKRDLMRTLAVLMWRRWGSGVMTVWAKAKAMAKKTMTVTLVMIALVLVLVIAGRRTGLGVRFFVARFGFGRRGRRTRTRRGDGVVGLGRTVLEVMRRWSVGV